MAVERRLRVVIADDDPSIRAWVRVALECTGAYEVVGEAADGAEALERVVALSPDAVVMDLQMPIVDGYTAVVMLQRRQPHVMVVVHSAEEDEVQLRDVNALGVPVVHKNGDAEPLIAALRNASVSALPA